MPAPALPKNETERLQALRALRLLDTAAEPQFDRYVRIARELFEVPVATVSLIDADRQWFKAQRGLDVAETARDISFCGHAILEQDVFHIPDAQADARFADNPLVAGAPHIRFYAGCPITVPGGLAIGTLCVLDYRPRQVSTERLMALRDLADCLQRELALRLVMADVKQLQSSTRLLTSPAFAYLATER